MGYHDAPHKPRFRGADRAVDLADEGKALTARLESKEGLIGRLLNDTEYSEKVAADLKDSIANVRAITAKIDSGQGTLGALVNERTLHDGMEEVVAGGGDSNFARWLMRHYQKKGIQASSPPAPAGKRD